MHVPAISVAIFLSSAISQPMVRATTASVITDVASPTTAVALVAVENGTMYDVYLVGATADIADSIEIRQKARGPEAAVVVKEVVVPAFGQLAMSADAVYLALVKVKRPLKPGESIPLNLVLDSGVSLTVQAVVK